jgi:hypothetical protein
MVWLNRKQHMTAQEIFDQATHRGLRLESRGNKLAVIPAKRCPPEFADTLRQHKQEILSLLEGQAAGLAPDCSPWLHVARQVIEGEFDGVMDNSVRGSLVIGLRSVPHPVCQRALARLKQFQNN